MFSRKVKTILQKAPDTLPDKTRPIYFPVPAILEPIFVAKVDSNEVVFIAFILTNNAIRLQYIGPFKDESSWSNCNVMAIKPARGRFGSDIVKFRL